DWQGPKRKEPTPCGLGSSESRSPLDEHVRPRSPSVVRMPREDYGVGMARHCLRCRAVASSRKNTTVTRIGRGPPGVLVPNLALDQKLEPSHAELAGVLATHRPTRFGHPTPLEPGQRGPDVPDVRVVVQMLLHRDELLALATLLERDLILGRGPDIETIAHHGVRVDVVETTIPPVGDQLSRRRER